MGFNWNLENLLKAKGIKNASELQKKLEDELGIKLTRQALHKLMKKEPNEIRLKTLQTICSLLEVTSSELLLITPEPKVKYGIESKTLYGRKTKSNFLSSDPREFLK